MSDLLLALVALIGFVVLVFGAAALVAIWIGKPPRKSKRRSRRSDDG